MHNHRWWRPCHRRVLMLLLFVPALLTAQEITVSVSNSPAMLGVLRAAERSGAEVVFHRTQNEAVVRLVRGDADVAILPIYVAAAVHNEGTPLVLSHAVYGNFLSVVQGSNAGRSVTRLSDLVGRDLLVGKQAGPLLVFPRLLMEDAGIADQVSTTGATAQQISQMLMTGQTELGVLREPLTTVVLQRNPESRRALNLQDEWEARFGSPMVQAGVVVRQAAMREHSNRIDQLLREIDQGYRWVRANPDAAAELAARRVPGINQAVVLAALPAMQISAERVGPETTANTNRVAAFLALLEERQPAMLSSGVPDSTFFGGQ